MGRYHTIKSYNIADYARVCAEVFNEMSERQTMFCICGKLATGLHENHCVKFNRAVDKETARRLDKLNTDKVSF